jgi:hypothetical protein
VLRDSRRILKGLMRITYQVLLTTNVYNMFLKCCRYLLLKFLNFVSQKQNNTMHYVPAQFVYFSIYNETLVLSPTVSNFVL